MLAFDYPMGNDTNARLAHSVHELINKLGIEKTVFIGESYGGYLAQMIIKSHAGRQSLKPQWKSYADPPGR